MTSLFLFVLVVSSVAFGASRFQPDAWYDKLIKPSFNPPNWIFAPVWSTLYIFLAVAGWLIWRQTNEPIHVTLVIWASQMFLNGIWSYLFFKRRRIDLALVDILTLLALILMFVVFAAPVSRWAALLFMPYALWVAFATTLNFRLWQLNRNP